LLTKRIGQRSHSLDISYHPDKFRSVQSQAVDEGSGHPGSFRRRNISGIRLQNRVAIGFDRIGYSED
jgi:hypothetical protein